MRSVLLALTIACLAGCGPPPSLETTKTRTGKPVKLPATSWTKGELSTDSAPENGFYKAKFETSKGDFIIAVQREWAPRGADRFYQLIKNGFYDGAPFFRVMHEFMVQFGIAGDPDATAYWGKDFPDEPVLKSNTRGMVSFAKTNMPNSRSTQVFINYKNNSSSLDRQRFSPFGKVISGMDIVESITEKYRESPNQQSLTKDGNQYAFSNYPELDYIVKATILVEGEGEFKADKTPTNSDGDGEEPEEEIVQFEKIRFPSKDGLEVTADLYAAQDDKSAPFIVLCHQAGWSRGEYREIAPKLCKLGFNCLAIDQRSGGKVNEVKNLTNMLAKQTGNETTFVDAEQDIVAALEYAKSTLAEGKLVLWGSSYSAALSLRIAGEHPELIDGVMAFAPGEYFTRFDRAEDWIQQSAGKISVPAFITSARGEVEKWDLIYKSIPGDKKTKFIPETDGNHGSRALWEKFEDNEPYWEATNAFLKQFVD